jgi:pyrroloquinoline quinone biosynthesis protein E
MAVAGDPAATDPTCSRSPHNAALRAAATVAAGVAAEFTYRTAPA